MNVTFAPSKRSRFRKCLLVNPRILRFGICNTAQRIRSPSKDWKLESKLTVPHTVPGIPRIRSVESGKPLTF